MNVIYSNCEIVNYMHLLRHITLLNAINFL